MHIIVVKHFTRLSTREYCMHNRSPEDPGFAQGHVQHGFFGNGAKNSRRAVPSDQVTNVAAGQTSSGTAVQVSSANTCMAVKRGNKQAARCTAPSSRALGRTHICIRLASWAAQPCSHWPQMGVSTYIIIPPAKTKVQTQKLTTNLPLVCSSVSCHLPWTLLGS